MGLARVSSPSLVAPNTNLLLGLTQASLQCFLNFEEKLPVLCESLIVQW